MVISTLISSCLLLGILISNKSSSSHRYVQIAHKNIIIEELTTDLNSLQEEIWFYEILYIFLFLIEKWIIIFFSSSFLKKNNSNIRILSNYISKNQISLLISFPFLISQISSLIFSICISNLLLLNYTKSQKYSIPLISYNFFGIIFSLIIIFLDILLFYIVMKKSLKSSK